MDKDVKYLIEEIRDIAKFNENHAMCAFKLGLIKGLCDGYLEFHKEIDNIVKTDNPSKVTYYKGEEVVHTTPEPATFEEYCKQEIEKNDNRDNWLDVALDRRGNHMNLTFEISARWNNPANKKMILKLLNQKQICTMKDLMAIFDNPVNFNTLMYIQSANKDTQKSLNKIFPLFELSDADRKQIAELYSTANDYPEIENIKGVLSNIYFQRFLTSDDTKSAYSKRYVNAFIRNGITNVNQLYFLLKEKGIKGVTNLRGVGHASDNIITMYEKIKEVK